MGHMHFDISIPLVSNTNLILAKTNSLYTVMYVLNEKRKKKDEIPHKALYSFNYSSVRSWLF